MLEEKYNAQIEKHDETGELILKKKIRAQAEEDKSL
jgi:hypothetical protein